MRCYLIVIAVWLVPASLGLAWLWMRFMNRIDPPRPPERDR